MAFYGLIGETMIEIGDLVKFTEAGKACGTAVYIGTSGVWLVLDRERDHVILTRGDTKQWAHIRNLDKISSSR